MIKNKIVGILGIPIKNLSDDPQRDLLGNPMRSWALYYGLRKYGYKTILFISPSTKVSSHLSPELKDGLVRSKDNFDVDKCNLDALVVCGTRFQVAQENNKWLDFNNLKIPIILAQCYHNDPSPIDNKIISKVYSAGFVSPIYARKWSSEYPNIPTFLITTGQVRHRASDVKPLKHVVFIGIIHNWPTIQRIFNIAQLDESIRYSIISGRIRVPNGAPHDYIGLDAVAKSNDERRAIFENTARLAGLAIPTNVTYHHMPPGCELDLVNTASVGIDLSWNKNWTIDNSKIAYYLSLGLNPITELPSPSYRFLDYFGVGCYLPYGSSPEKFLESINSWVHTDADRRNELRNSAGLFFSWDNVAFEIASQLNSLFSQL